MKNTQWNKRTPIALAVVFMIAGCGSDLRGDHDDDGGGGADAGSSHITNTDTGSGVSTTRVDASKNDLWVYFDLESKSEVFPTSPDSSGDWDLGFQRFKIKSNGGISGIGNMEVAVLPGTNFDTLTQAPASGYVTDQADSADEGNDPDFAFLSGTGRDAWYSYNPSDHTLSPRDVVYVVKTVEGHYFKVKMTAYYDGAGTAGYPAFQWAAVAAPSGAASLTVDASSATAWVYLSLSSGGIVTVSGDPAMSTVWDVAISRTKIITNSGTSGGGLGGARMAPSGSTYAALTQSPTIGFVKDTMLPNPGPPGSGEFSGNPLLNGWYNYDETTHVVTPKDEVFLVRSASGNYGKLKILTYASGVYTLQLATITRNVTTQTSTITASDGAAWVYVDFRLGEVVTVTDPATSAGWDMGLSRTKLRTNSGTSGAGLGGAIDPAATMLSVITTAPSGTYAADTMIPNPGPPGSGEFSGNTILDGWYDYDPATHVTTPKDKAFVVRTADGGFVKFKITSWANGVFGIDWAYSGAGQSSF